MVQLQAYYNAAIHRLGGFGFKAANRVEEGALVRCVINLTFWDQYKTLHVAENC